MFVNHTERTRRCHVYVRPACVRAYRKPRTRFLHRHRLPDTVVFGAFFLCWSHVSYVFNASCSLSASDSRSRNGQASHCDRRADANDERFNGVWPFGHGKSHVRLSISVARSTISSRRSSSGGRMAGASPSPGISGTDDGLATAVRDRTGFIHLRYALTPRRSITLSDRLSLNRFYKK